MTPNSANTISKHGQGCEGIVPQGKGIHNSRKLGKVVAINRQTNSFQKVLYSKSNCSKPTTPVFYELKPPEKRTNYSVLD